MRRTAQEHLLDTELSLSATLGVIGAGFISADADGRILRLNDVAERLTGWTAANAAGRPVPAVIRSANGSRADVGTLTRIAHLAANGDTVTVGFALARRGGGEALVRVTSTITRDDSGNARGMTMLIIDETELKAAEKEIDRLAAIVD
jgi:PAS domain S-box-containing protein